MTPIHMGSTAHPRLPLLAHRENAGSVVQGFACCIKLKDMLIACRVISYFVFQT